MFKIYGQYLLNKIRRFYKRKRSARLITTVLFIFVLGLVALGIYLFFREGFGYIKHDEYFRRALTLYVFEAYLLFVFCLVFLNAIISGLFLLFKGGNDAWIMASPEHNRLPWVILIKILFSSLWPILLIVLPAFAAVWRVYSLPWYTFLLSIIIMALYTVMVVFLAFLLLLSVGIILVSFKTSRWLSIRTYSAALLSLVVLFVVIAWGGVVDSDLVLMFRVHEVDAVEADISAITKSFAVFPSHLSAKGLFELSQNNLGSGVFSALLSLLTVLGLMIIVSISARFFLPIWQRLQEGLAPIWAQKQKEGRRPSSIMSFGNGPYGALIRKELLVSTRNVKDLLWFGFLFFIWLAQAGVNTMLSQTIVKHDLSLEMVPPVIEALQFATASFFISAFVLRFVFPSMSTERRTAWIIGTAPVEMRSLFFSKLVYFIGILSVASLLVQYSIFKTIDLPINVFGLGLLFLIISSWSITVLGMSLGASFPNFDTDDPSVLSTTLPGLVFMFLSLTYGALGALALYQYFSGSGVWQIIIFGAVSLFIMVVSLRLSVKKLKNYEFIKMY